MSTFSALPNFIIEFTISWRWLFLTLKIPLDIGMSLVTNPLTILYCIIIITIIIIIIIIITVYIVISF